MPTGRRQLDVGEWLRKVAVWALYATAFTPLVFSSRTIYPYVVPRAAYFRWWVAVAAGVAIYLLLTRRPAPDEAAARRRGPLADPVLLAIAALVVVQLVAALAGEAPERSLFGDMERMGGVLAWVHFGAFYFALRAILDDREMRTYLCIVMVVTAGVSSIAILQSLGVTIGILPGTGSARAIGTLGNAGYLGIFAALGMAVAGLVWATFATPRARVGAVTALVIHAVALALTYTRAAMLGVGCGLLVGIVSYALLSGWKRRRVALASLGGLSLLVGIVAWAVWIRPPASGAGAGGPTAMTLLRQGVASRLGAWEAGAHALADDPVTGLGPENFRLAFDWHFQPERFPPERHYTRAHNDLVESLVSGGVPGGLAWLALWGALFYALVAAYREKRIQVPEAALLAGAFAAYFVYVLFWFREQNSLPLLLALAAFVGVRRSGRYLDWRSGSRRSVGVRLGVGVLVLTAVAAGAVYHGRLIAAGHQLVRARQERTLGARMDHYERALALRPPGAEDVVTELARFASVLPGAVGQRLQDPTTRARVGEVLDRARRGLAGLLDADSRNPRLHREAGRLDVMRYQVGRDPSHLDSAVASLERAIALAPGRLRYRHMLSETYLLAGRSEEAVGVLEAGLDRWAGLAETHYFHAKALLIAEEYERAAESLVRAYEMGYPRPSTLAVHRAIARGLRERGMNDVASHLLDVRRSR